MILEEANSVNRYSVINFSGLSTSQMATVVSLFDRGREDESIQLANYYSDPNNFSGNMVNIIKILRSINAGSDIDKILASNIDLFANYGLQNGVPERLLWSGYIIRLAAKGHFEEAQIVESFAKGKFGIYMPGIFLEDDAKDALTKIGVHIHGQIMTQIGLK